MNAMNRWRGVIEEYRKKIDEAKMPEHVQKQAERELSRLERMGEQNAESATIRTASNGHLSAYLPGRHR